MTLEQVRAEALQESATVTWRDLKFTVAPVDTWMVRFMHYYERDQITRAIEQALGTRQYEAFIEAGPTMGDLGALVNSLASAYGLDLGEA